jgi:hypothetical protein
VNGSPATGSLYGVVTFVALAGAFVFVVNQAFGWEAVPTANRLQATVMLLYYCAAGFFAMKVGRHRDVSYPEALRRGAIDLGRSVKGLIFR